MRKVTFFVLWFTIPALLVWGHDLYPTVSTLSLSLPPSRSLLAHRYSLMDGACILQTDEALSRQCLKRYEQAINKVMASIQKYYPEWVQFLNAEVAKPWGNVSIFLNRKNACPAFPVFDFFRSMLQKMPAQASQWWIQTTSSYLSSLADGGRVKALNTLRPLDVPIGDGRTVGYDWILLKWVEDVDPEDEVLGHIWTGQNELEGIQPLYAYLTSKGLDVQEWFSGFFLHWALQYPKRSAPSNGEVVLQPGTASFLDVPAMPDETEGAWVIRLYLDATSIKTVWIAVWNKDGNISLYHQPITNRTFDVVLPGREFSHFRLIFIHPGEFPQDVPLMIRWTLEWRFDVPCSLLYAEAHRDKAGVTLEWEADRQLYGKSWIIERWDENRGVWKAIHSVPYPAASGFYFPVHYVFLDQDQHMPQSRLKYRLVLILSSGIRTVVKEFEVE